MSSYIFKLELPELLKLQEAYTQPGRHFYKCQRPDRTLINSLENTKKSSITFYERGIEYTGYLIEDVKSTFHNLSLEAKLLP